jgi:hypothetical protein
MLCTRDAAAPATALCAVAPLGSNMAMGPPPPALVLELEAPKPSFEPECDLDQALPLAAATEAAAVATAATSATTTAGTVATAPVDAAAQMEAWRVVVLTCARAAGRKEKVFTLYLTLLSTLLSTP